MNVASRNLAAGRRGSGATLPSFILTSRPFIASESEVDGGDEYFQGSKKPVWDELPPNSQVCIGWRGARFREMVKTEIGVPFDIVPSLDTSQSSTIPA